jgi:hypothetical protein
VAKSIVVKVVGHTRDFDQALAKSTSRSRKFGAAAKIAGALAITGLAVGLKKSVDAAKEAEVSQRKMQAQLKTLGLSYQANRKQINEVIQAQSRLSAFDDEDLQDSFTNIVRITKDVNEALRLNALAADFARAKNIPVAKAGELIAKVAGGNIGILSRYGIAMKKGATSTEALGILQKKFGGQAEAYGQSTAGAQDRFNVATENLQETIGQKLLPALTGLLEIGIKVIDFISKHSTIFTIVAAGIGALAVATWAWNLALAANPVVLVIAGVVALGVALVMAYKKSETFRNIVNAVFNAVKKVVTTVVNFIKDHWKTLFPVIAAIVFVVKKVIENWDRIKDAARNVIDWVRDRFRGLVDFFKELPGRMGDAILAGANRLKEAVFSLLRKVLPSWAEDALGISSPSKVFEKIGNAVVDGLIVGIKSKIGDLKSAALDLAGSLRFHGAGVDIPSNVSGILPFLLDFARSVGGVSVSSTTGGTHAANSYHYQGRAIDVVGSIATLVTFFRQAERLFGSKIKELFFDPMGYYIKNGQKISGAIGGHGTHVHLALEKGGIFTKPWTGMVSVAERGKPEGFVPLRGQSLGNTYITINAPNYVGSKEELARAVVSEINRYKKRGGSFSFA